MEAIETLITQSGLAGLTWQEPVMWLIGALFVWLGIKRNIEPLLLVPIGFTVIMVNMPLGGLMEPGSATEPIPGLLYMINEFGLKTDLIPLLIFLGLGAMTDFGPLIADPKMLLLGAAAQFGVFVAFLGAIALGFDFRAASAIGIIGGADGPTTIFTSTSLQVPDAVLGACAISAYSYMAMVPIIQPAIIRLLTSKEERGIKMKQLRPVAKAEKMLFPVLGGALICLLVPKATPLISMFMLGNLFMTSGAVERLTGAAKNELMNIVTIFLGLAVGSTMQGEHFLQWEVLGIYLLGLVAFSFSTAGGVIFAKVMNRLSSRQINPLLGSAGVSAVPMAARVSQKMATEANPKCYILMHAMGPNVAGVVGTVVVAGILITLNGAPREAAAPPPPTPVVAEVQTAPEPAESPELRPFHPMGEGEKRREDSSPNPSQPAPHPAAASEAAPLR